MNLPSYRICRSLKYRAMDNGAEQRQMRTLTIITSDAYGKEKAFYRRSPSMALLREQLSN